MLYLTVRVPRLLGFAEQGTTVDVERRCEADDIEHLERHVDRYTVLDAVSPVTCQTRVQQLVLLGTDGVLEVHL